MNYREALAYLDSHINYETGANTGLGSRVIAGDTKHLSLSAMAEIMHVLGDPQNSYRVIHITGTNGKGSVSRMVSAILTEMGLRVGTYTSPHLVKVNERIAVDGEPISDSEFAEMITDLATIIPLTEISPTFFELLTAGALQYFAQAAVDVAVIEVGMLGRYDATNICHADVAVVTSLGKDHTDGQGDWRSAIASEKAGIIKPDSTLVCGVDDSALRSIFLQEGAAHSWFRNEQFEILTDQIAFGGHSFRMRTPLGATEDVYLPLYGEHQVENAACAIAAVDAFFDKPTDTDLINDAFARLTVPARFEIMRHSPLVIVDAAHNRDGVASLVKTLTSEFDIPGRRIYVFGVLQGRDPVEFLEAADVRSADLVITTSADSPRSFPARQLAEIVQRFGVMTEVIEDIDTAVQRAIDVSTEGDVVVVAGSLYVVGPARHYLESHPHTEVV